MPFFAALPAENLRLDRPLLLSRVSRSAPINANCAPLTARLIEVARTNKNRAVRKQAIFWLGQSNDARALKFFEEILTQ